MAKAKQTNKQKNNNNKTLAVFTLDHRCYPKGRFTRYDFVACDKFMTGLQHELFRVNQTYNLLTTVVYVTKNVLIL